MTLQSVERWNWVGESIGDREENKRERAGTHVFFLYLLRHFSHSFSTLSRSLCLSWMAAWQQRRLFLASSLLPFSKNSLSCAGLLQPVWGLSPPFFLPILIFFFLAFSHSFCVPTQTFPFLSIYFCTLFVFISSHNFPIFLHLIILKHAFLISPFLTNEILSLFAENKMKKQFFSPLLSSPADWFGLLISGSHWGPGSSEMCSIRSAFRIKG